MGIFDKAKDALSSHSDKAAPAVDKVGDMIDEKTGSKYAGQVDKGQALAKERLAQQNQAGEANQAGEGEPPATTPV